MVRSSAIWLNHDDGRAGTGPGRVGLGEYGDRGRPRVLSGPTSAICRVGIRPGVGLLRLDDNERPHGGSGLLAGAGQHLPPFGLSHRRRRVATHSARHLVVVETTTPRRGRRRVHLLHVCRYERCVCAQSPAPPGRPLSSVPHWPAGLYEHDPDPRRRPAEHTSSNLLVGSHFIPPTDLLVCVHLLHVQRVAGPAGHDSQSEHGRVLQCAEYRRVVRGRIGDQHRRVPRHLWTPRRSRQGEAARTVLFGEEDPSLCS